MTKLKIGFICVHNSCRSILAEAITRQKYGDIVLVYSAGTAKKDQVNSDAISILKSEYLINENFEPKLISSLPELDIVITMGCNVECPFLEAKYRADFGIEDPTGKGKNTFKLTAKIIELKIDLLMLRIENNLIEELSEK